MTCRYIHGLVNQSLLTANGWKFTQRPTTYPSVHDKRIWSVQPQGIILETGMERF